MKKTVVSLLMLCAMMCVESAQAQNAVTFWKNGRATVIDTPDSVTFNDSSNPQNTGNAATYWRDGQPTVVSAPDSMFLWNGSFLFSGEQDGNANVVPTSMETFIGQLPSDEETAPVAAYSAEDSLSWDALAKEVLNKFAAGRQEGTLGAPLKRLSQADGEQAQEVVRTNGINQLRGLVIEQLDWNSGQWGNTRYGGFETYFNTSIVGGKRYLLVVFYYPGGFPNKKTAHVKLGQVNSGPIVGSVNIYPGQEYAFVKVCLDDYIKGYGCANFCPLLITEGTKARNYLNPLFVRQDPIVAPGWREQYFGYELGTVNGVSVYYNKDTYDKKRGTLRNQSMASDAIYQSVELCKRYVRSLNKGIQRVYGWGNANQWPANRAGDDIDAGKYLVFPNDGRQQVREGDLVVWDHTTWGHIGVVVKTAPSYVSVAHQNAGVGTNDLPIGSQLKVENGIVRDIKPGSDHSPIFGGVVPIPYFIRVNSIAETAASYSATMDVSTTNLSFGPVEVEGSLTKSFVVSNPRGSSTLTVSSVSLSRGGAFSTDAAACTIGPGETRTFSVTFSPAATGNYDDRIVITSNADDNPTWTIRLSGIGQGEAMAGTIDISPRSINFGTVGENSPQTRSFTVRNTGYYDITFSVSQPPYPFSIPEAGRNITLHQGDSHDVEVTCAGLDPGEVVENVFVRISSNAANHHEVNGIMLSANGEGTGPECPAMVTIVELAGVEYKILEDLPNIMYFNVNAVLKDLTDVEEWGVYFNRDNEKLTFSFESVYRAQNITLSCSSTGENGLMKLDVNNFVATYDDMVGVYVKKLDRKTGEQIIIYGDMFPFSLRYDTPPSFTFSSPYILETKELETDGDNIKYQTSFMFHYNLLGAFWIDYIDTGISGSNWSLGENAIWVAQRDRYGDQKWSENYWSNSGDLGHSIWRILHLRNYKTMTSNYLNFKGEGKLTDVWVTSSPVYAPKSLQDKQMKPAGTQEATFPYVLRAGAPEEQGQEAEASRTVRKAYPYKGGMLGVCK